jgi:transposase
MLPFSLILNKKARVSLKKALDAARAAGDRVKINRINSLLMLSNNFALKDIAEILGVTAESIRSWVKKYLIGGIRALNSNKIPGRPSKLTKTQRKELSKIIDAGPEQAGFPGGCWRTPMIQLIIERQFGVLFNVRYISELLRNMGYSFQKAKFESSKADKETRKKWLENTWPEILEVAKSKNAHIMFGDEASFPQWGSLNYTWSKKGVQPVVKTSGSRRGYKVFGLIEYFSGKFYSKGHEGRFNSDSYMAFLKDVLGNTRKHIVLIQDGAPYHKGKKIKEFFAKHSDRLTVYTLPSYSPDYNPIELLWKKIKQTGTHLVYFETFEALIGKVNEMLNLFSEAKNEVLALFGFYTKKEKVTA